MIDFIMNLLGYENINKIKVPEEYRIPRTDKMRCKANFYNVTGKFQDKIIINQERILLDGYITLLLCKWAKRKYVKVMKINCSPAMYKLEYRGYRLKPKEKRQEM